MDLSSKIFVAGHNGLVGSAIVRRLRQRGYYNLLLCGHSELDLENQAGVQRFFRDNTPTHVFLAAAKVGGIWANNQYPADFIRSNLVIQTNVIDAAYRSGVEKLMFLGSSCIYPKMAPQPIKEEYLLTGPLEPTNEPYAVAKIAGILLCQSYNRQYGTRFISVMPTNLYGPGDNFDIRTSHVLPALIRKFAEAKRDARESVEVWGTGTVSREFLHVDDMADAGVFLMQTYEGSDIVNVGSGTDVTVAEAASIVRDVVGFDGRIIYDTTKPDGTPRKLLDVSRLISMGWRPTITLRDGLAQTYRWYIDHVDQT